MSNRVLKWVLFSVLFSLLPIIFDYIIAIGPHKGLPDIADVLSHGELCIVGATLSGVAAGEIHNAKVKSENIGTSLFFGSIISAILNGVLYTAIKTNAQAPENSAYYWTSILMFFFAVVIATSCISVTEKAGE